MSLFLKGDVGLPLGFNFRLGTALREGPKKKLGLVPILEICGSDMSLFLKGAVGSPFEPLVFRFRTALKTQRKCILGPKRWCRDKKLAMEIAAVYTIPPHSSQAGRRAAALVLVVLAAICVCAIAVPSGHHTELLGYVVLRMSGEEC